MNFYEKKYGQRETNQIVALTCALVRRYCAPLPPDLEILDIGCGTMHLSTRIAESIQAAMPRVRSIHLTGWDISSMAVQEAQNRGLDAHTVDITRPLPETADRFNVICFLEVLEHIVDTDQAIRNIYALLRPDGFLVLSTPNLASWYNRLFLILGLQPHCAEVSFDRCFGNWITQKLFSKGHPAGHLRLFTLSALLEFLRYHGFEILALRGISNHRLDLISKALTLCSASLCGDICLIARKRQQKKAEGG